MGSKLRLQLISRAISSTTHTCTGKCATSTMVLLSSRLRITSRRVQVYQGQDIPTTRTTHWRIQIISRLSLARTKMGRSFTRHIIGRTLRSLSLPTKLRWACKITWRVKEKLCSKSFSHARHEIDAEYNEAYTRYFFLTVP